MSGCCGQSPVVISGPTPSRVNVETEILCDVLADGTVAATVLLEPVYDTSSGARVGTRTVDPVTGAAYTVQGTLQTCATAPPCQTCETLQLCDTAADGAVTLFLRTICRNCAGQVTTTTDTTLDGTTAYTPAGTVGECTGPCRDSNVLLLCDVPQDGSPAATVTDTDPTPYYPFGTGAPVTGAQVLWDGGTLDLPAGTAPQPGAPGMVNSLAAIVQAPRPACDTGTAHVAVAVNILQQGPDNGCAQTGHVRLFNGTTQAALALLPVNTPAGWFGTVTVEADVPAADLAAGNIAVAIALDGYDDTPGACDPSPRRTGWQLSAFTTAATYDQAGCDTQFLRTVTVDCETGQVTGTTDTTIDGAPYTLTGQPGECQATQAEQQRYDAEIVELCDTAADGTVTPFLRHVSYGTLGGAVAAVTDTTLDGLTAYSPAGAVGRCPQTTDCDSPTTPTTTIGLCLADGTPIAVVMTRDCAGTVTRDGWVNLVTGAFAAGAPPAGTLACGDSQSIQVSGTFCDVDASGNVLGLVLVEYTYAADGSIESVRLVDATTGQTYTPQGTVTVCPTGTEQPEQDLVQLCDVAADGTVTSFVRDFRRDELGAITGHSDYLLDGTAYTPTGTVGVCVSPCLNCETLLLCDEGGNDPATISGTGMSSGTLANGVAWSSRGSAPLPATYSNADGSWWGLATFPNSVFPNSTWTLSRPAIVEFSVYIRYHAGGTGTDNTAQLPAGLEVVSLPDGYTYDPATGILTATGDTLNDPCTYLTDPHVATSPRFRTTNPVTTVTARYLGARIANCGVFGNYKIGAFQITPPGQFLRTICRDCGGAVVSVLDTELDGTTAYTPLGAVGVCEPPPDPEPEACCQPVQVCIQQDTTQQVEFISNEEHRNDNTVDPVWKWTTDLNAASPPWYDMYQRQYSAAWSVVDSDTARPAWWVSPHPDGASAQASPALPNEGPSLLNTHWYPRAFFDLPANADPASIKVQATVFNADQIGRAFRLNSGAWQTLPATATHNGTTYVFGPDTIPGAQAGRNTLDLDVEETVGGGAGLMVHLIVTYEVIPETRSWTRMICCDNTVYYLDEDGQRQDAVPDGWHLAACGGSGSTLDCAKQVVERCGCDDTTGDGTGDVTFTELWAVDPCGGAAPVLMGTYLDGGLTQPYTPVAPVECTAADLPPGPLSTGVRNVTGTAAQNLAGSFPTLQSVSLTVLAGSVNVTMTDGSNVAVPAGVSLTWSVTKEDDAALAAASFAGATAASQYLLNYTYR
ncbi:hypothetical protein ABTX60_07245 [Streptomyces sp. NPDC126510]|uniref:hypothetical protein n=1 Tax=Streptomyces sp. NPDC126510 TaxID=3155317 RepID=UPI003328974F